MLDPVLEKKQGCPPHTLCAYTLRNDQAELKDYYYKTTVVLNSVRIRLIYHRNTDAECGLPIAYSRFSADLDPNYMPPPSYIRTGVLCVDATSTVL